MSVFRTTRVTCPSCHATQDFRSSHSVNADLRDDLRLSILNDEFQRTTCTQCQAAFRVEPEFTYVDVGRGQWVAALPLQRMTHWPAEEEHAQALFKKVYTGSAPEPIQAIGRGLQARLVFGWGALREKLLANEHALDDVGIELCKAAVLRSAPAVPLDAQTEMRLIGVDGTDLIFAWIYAATESIGDTMRVKRALYDMVTAEAPSDWDELRGDLSGGFFVDLNRLLVEAS